MQKPKIVLAISGASGSIYAKRFIDLFDHENQQLEIITSDKALYIYQQEMGHSFNQENLKYYRNNDFKAPFASGSAIYGSDYRSLVILPASMGTIGRVAHGISDDLMTRAADVFLKESRQMIVCPRETPFSTLHIENLLKLSRMGVKIIPTNPSFYSKPETIEALVDTVIARIFDHLGVKHNLKNRYGIDC